MNDLFTVAELADALGVPQQAIRDICKVREIGPDRMVGRYWLFNSATAGRITEALVALRRAKAARQRKTAERVELYDMDGVAAKLGVDPVRVQHALDDRPANKAMYLCGGKPLFAEMDVELLRIELRWQELVSGQPERYPLGS